jgi:hypothetical protein
MNDLLKVTRDSDGHAGVVNINGNAIEIANWKCAFFI